MSERTSTFQAANRVLDPDDCQREPFAGVNRGIAEQIAREKAEAGQQLSYVYPSKVWEYPWAITRHPLPDGEIVLDAGCGVSALPIYLAARGATVVAIDNDMRWLSMEGRAATFHRVPVVPVQMDMTALAFPDESFDRVYCISVLEHIEQERQPTAVREMVRVLRPGGLFYLTVDYDERERRSDDDVVYDRLALQRWGIAPSGCEIEGTTDYSRPDWDEHHHRMRAFKMHTFAAMAVALRKPPASGPESGAAIAARRSRAGRADDGFFAGIDLGDLGSIDGDRIARAAALGARDVRIDVLGGGEAVSRDGAGRAAGIDEARLAKLSEVSARLRAAGLSAWWSLLDGRRADAALVDGAEAAEAFAARVLAPLLERVDVAGARAIAPLAGAEGSAARLDWGRVHAWTTAVARAAHERAGDLPIAGGSSVSAIVDGRLDGAALDVYALDAAEGSPSAAALPPAAFVSLVRDVVVGSSDGASAIDRARELGYAGIFVLLDRASDETIAASLRRHALDGRTGPGGA